MEKFWFYRKFWQSTQKQLEMTSSSSPSLKLFSSVFSFSLSLLRLGSDENVPFLRETNSLSRELDSRDNFKILKCHAMSSQDIAKRNFTSLHQTRNCFIALTFQEFPNPCVVLDLTFCFGVLKRWEFLCFPSFLLDLGRQTNSPKVLTWLWWRQGKCLKWFGESLTCKLSHLIMMHLIAQTASDLLILLDL